MLSDERVDEPMRQPLRVEPDDDGFRDAGGIGEKRGASIVLDPLKLRERHDKSRRARVDRVSHQCRRQPGCRERREMLGALPPGIERRRPVGRPERARRRVEPLKHIGTRTFRVEQIHGPDDPTDRRPILGARVRVGQRSGGIAVEHVERHMEREIRARQLAIEIIAEICRARPKAGAEPFAFGVAHLSEPPVLKRRQHREQHEERPDHGQLPECAAHVFTLSEKSPPSGPDVRS